MSFSDLKKKSSNQLKNLVSELEKMNTKSFESNGDDDRYWKLTVDKAGNGHAVIRFLPAPTGEDIPWVRLWDHGFQGPGGWYIENSLTTIGKKDPVSEYNSQLWNSGLDSDKEIARKQKRRLKYFSNILVVEDPANPENNGKVFLFQYGKKIFDKINEAMNPEFEDDEAMNPFDLWDGANFKLRARKVAGYRNYDNSAFASPGQLFDDEAEMEAAYNKCNSLEELVTPENFKSYDDLKSRLNKVLGTEVVDPTGIDDIDPEPEIPAKEATGSSFAESVDDDELDYFSKLADES